MSIWHNLYPHEQDLIKRMCGLVVLHKSPSAVHTVHKYSKDWRERSTTNQGSLPVCPCARPCRLHTRSSGEYPRMRRGCPPPPLSNLLQIDHVVSSLQTKKKKKNANWSRRRGGVTPLPAAGGSVKEGKGRKLEREAEREENIFPI